MPPLLTFLFQPNWPQDKLQIFSRNFFAPGGPGPYRGRRALRLQPHQPHGWSGHGYCRQQWPIIKQCHTHKVILVLSPVLFIQSPYTTSSKFEDFLRATAVPAGMLWRVLAMGILSVRLSVTTRCYTKPRWDRDSGSSRYDSLECLVSYEVIWCHWVKTFPSNEGIKEGYLNDLEPPKRWVLSDLFSIFLLF